jgi:hypothetical protein
MEIANDLWGKVDFANNRTLTANFEQNSTFGMPHGDGRIVKLQFQTLKKTVEVMIAEVAYVYKPLWCILAEDN